VRRVTVAVLSTAALAAVIVVETAYPFTTEDKDGWENIAPSAGTPLVPDTAPHRPAADELRP
jgi:arabinogalactan endo-1,4-beta-galactosidase